jgi:hypothetical protein
LWFSGRTNVTLIAVPSSTACCLTMILPGYSLRPRLKRRTAPARRATGEWIAVAYVVQRPRKVVSERRAIGVKVGGIRTRRGRSGRSTRLYPSQYPDYRYLEGLRRT